MLRKFLLSLIFSPLNNWSFIELELSCLKITSNATNSSAHSYNTRNKHKLRAAYGKHNFMYSNFRFVGIEIWNYITDHLDINITLPKFKKMLKIFLHTNDNKLLLS